MLSEILDRAASPGITALRMSPLVDAYELHAEADGEWQPFMAVNVTTARYILAQVKDRSYMDLAERRKPQTGRTFVQYGVSHRVEVSAEITIGSDGDEILFLRLSTSPISALEVAAATRAYDKVLVYLSGVAGRKAHIVDIEAAVYALKTDIGLLA